MKPDILINGISMLGLGWLRESIDFPTPQPQSETITVPGRNSPIRYTEALGRVSYQPRSFDITLSMLGSRSMFNTMVENTVNRIAGRLCRVICNDEPELYAIGTLECISAYNPLTGKGQLTISCTDGDSFRYHVEETVVTISGSGILLPICRKRRVKTRMSCRIPMRQAGHLQILCLPRSYSLTRQALL